ncbi:hypothetical protein ABZ445_40545 [Streptomyces chartreusis]|uniref:hypothetical protein n=1 Tax=Streptomyces chartreusis TaxID=1969 RepID=UPI0033E1E6A0
MAERERLPRAVDEFEFVAVVTQIPQRGPKAPAGVCLGRIRPQGLGNLGAADAPTESDKGHEALGVAAQWYWLAVELQAELAEELQVGVGR